MEELEDLKKRIAKMNEKSKETLKIYMTRVEEPWRTEAESENMPGLQEFLEDGLHQ